MVALVANEQNADLSNPFVQDSELGWGRVNGVTGTISFFDSPARPEIVLPSAGRTYRAATLSPQQRAWWFDGNRWIVGRINSAQNAQADSYFVHLPNGDTQAVPSRELRVRWSLPLVDPLGLLKVGTVETRFFHGRRTAFLRSVMAQRNACLGLGGVLSSAVEIHDHQVGAARRVLADPIPRYLLADEVGLGKTIEAGMVLRQLLLQTEGAAVVIVPDPIIGQWRRELATKFRIDYLPGKVVVVGHSAISRIRPEPRMLTIVDEAHRFTDQVSYGGRGVRDREYEQLRAIAHASKALLLLSATPVRSNEDAFLGLLHLLDPAIYPLSDLQAFRRRVEMRDGLAEAMSAVGAETPLRYLCEPLDRIADLLAGDPVAEELIVGTRRHIAARADQEARQEIDRLRIYVSEAYRLHRRMIRSRRSAAAKKGFPARGRELANPWLIPDLDDRRQDVFGAFDDLRLALELTGDRSAGHILQVVLGRLLAPVTALDDLLLALRGQPGHDLSAWEMAIVRDFAQMPAGLEFAGDLAQISALTTRVDRLSAAVGWARQRVGRRKHAIACSFPRTAGLLAEMLAAELGQHRVAALLEGQGDEERARLTADFESSQERCILVLDRSAEEGANLQFIEEVLHLDVPTVSSRLEQRMGRFDRWSELATKVRSVTFREADPIGHQHLDAWTMTLNDVFGAFTASTSTLQYVLADLEDEFFRTAVSATFAGAREHMVAQAGLLDAERRRIAAQDLLDSIQDRAADEDLARRLAAIDSKQRDIEQVVDGYLVDMLRFSAVRGDEYIRFGVSKAHPPLLTEASVQAVGARAFDLVYTADRIMAGSGLGFLRWGEPLVNAFAGVAETDDRGKAFAVEVQWPSRDPDRESWVAFCLDIRVEPGRLAESSLSGADAAFARAVTARTDFFLPTTVERVWWVAGRGECDARLVQDLERSRGENLGSRPERFSDLTAPVDWERACDEALGHALTLVRERPTVMRRLAAGRRRAATARELEAVIRQARARIDAEHDRDDEVMELVEKSLAQPVFSLESCGAVFITWVGRP
jgi:ATP-dependent helicase HepA